MGQAPDDLMPLAHAGTMHGIMVPWPGTVLYWGNLLGLCSRCRCQGREPGRAGTGEPDAALPGCWFRSILRRFLRGQQAATGGMSAMAQCCQRHPHAGAASWLPAGLLATAGG